MFVGIDNIIRNSCSDDSYNPMANQYRINDNSMDNELAPCCVYPPEDINQ